MKNFKNFAIYGLPTCSLSNICAADGFSIDDMIEMYNHDEMNDADDTNENGGFGSGGLLDNKNIPSCLVKVLKGNNKKEGLDFLNTYIFNTEKNIKGLDKHNNIKYKLCKEEGKTNKNLLILFHGLGQEIKEYFVPDTKTGKTDIGILQEKFGADVLLIEYDFNDDNNNTFDGIDKYCEDVAKFISTKLKGYDNLTFFGYSLGSFVGNLTRQKFNDIKDENVTSKYIGYKGIKDLDNAGSSFIKTLIKDTNIKITEKNICSGITLALNTVNLLKGMIHDDGGKKISIEKFSDLFKYLLGEKEYNKIKTLTTNASILKNTRGFDKDKVVFNDKLVTKGHNIDLKEDIATILKALDENKDKDVFLFQCEGGDEIVGKGMEDTYKSLTGKKPKNTDPKSPKGGPKDDEDNGGPKDEHNKINQGGENQGKEEEKTNSCLCF